MNKVKSKMEQEAANPNILKMTVDIEGNVFTLTKIVAWLKKASEVLGFKYKIYKNETR